MKLVYTLAATMLASFVLFNGASAQTYTVVRSGNWSVNSGPTTPWDVNGKPADNCSNCVITINSGDTLTLDAHVTLTGTSLFKIGSDGSAAAQLLIPASGGTDFASSFNLVLSSAGSDNTALKLLYSNTTVDATAAGIRDGVFSVNGSYQKQIGNGPATIFNPDGSFSQNGTVQGGSLATGVKTFNGVGTLPVILMNFSAASDKGAVDLNWTTAQESNSDHFVVERSTDGGTLWQNIGTVAAKGFSASPVDYSFADQSAVPGVTEYRLELVDRDGKYGYSSVKVVHTNLIGGVSLFPNPAKDYVNVSLGSGANQSIGVRLLNQSGQVLLERQLNGSAGTTLSLPVSNYPEGTYLVVVTGSDGSRQVSKLFISRQ